jgi:hypothetical protein
VNLSDREHTCVNVQPSASFLANVGDAMYVLSKETLSVEKATGQPLGAMTRSIAARLTVLTSPSPTTTMHPIPIPLVSFNSRSST